MLGKLIKYDLRFGAKTYAFMAALTAALLLIMGAGRLIKSDLLFGLFLAFAIMASLAFFVLYIVISVRHLYSQMCGNESIMGYTLPVSPHTLVLSKLVSMLIWAVATAALLVLYWWLAIDAMILRPQGMSLSEMFSGGLDLLSHSGLTLDAGFWAAVTALLIIGVVQFIVTLSACTAIANIPVLKERGAGVAVGVCTFIFGGQIVYTLLTVIYGAATNSAGAAWYEALDMNTAEEITNYLIFHCVAGAVIAVALYFVTVWLTDKKRSI
ncbi:ABC transporter permease [Clostridia bacterium]|nr:ABC transporter permease [Clostridia bacterium]